MNKLNIVGLYLYKEIRTGGHRRYIELMEGLASKGNNVTIIVNKDFTFPFKYVRFIPIEVQYKQGQRFPVSLIFKKVLQRNKKAILQQCVDTDWILIFSETNIFASHYLKKILNANILYGHRSNTVQEALQYIKEHNGKPLKQVKFVLNFIKYSFYEHIISSITNAIVFQSIYDKEDFLSRNKSARNKSFVIGGHIGLPRYTQEYQNINTSTHVEKLLFLGTTGPRKGLKYLLEALVILYNKGLHNLSLNVIGPGDLEPHTSYLKENNLLNIVKFYGRIDNPFPYLKENDLMVIPSLFDSYPNTVLESLHTGIPVIASSVGGIPEMLQYPELLFPPADSYAIADTIYKIVTDNEYYRYIRRLCAQRLPFFHFDWELKWEEVMKSYIKV
ncbi:glycosyltransferase family 4 protein [Gracilinema caldarium]|uniref:Glycosyl transferase group 1 n=1 Tax=Gracilinema caldarium (strain ATCC 51460 / DSM 7334 / H1) TaxID=744872 RepID=F8EXM4_GRAC1|nr:glycosyltransferase family 4 protein [Gracilinema caldarium]AEJ19605.1 glycosyl transferase group 1 [Gracilinema caldarium DSM 7334]